MFSEISSECVERCQHIHLCPAECAQKCGRGKRIVSVCCHFFKNHFEFGKGVQDIKLVCQCVFRYHNFQNIFCRCAVSLCHVSKLCKVSFVASIYIGSEDIQFIRSIFKERFESNAQIASVCKHSLK